MGIDPSTITNEFVLNNHPIDIFLYLNKIDIFANSDWLNWEPEVFLGNFKKVTTNVAMAKLLAIWGVCGNMDVASNYCLPFSNVVSSFCNCGAHNTVTPSHIEEIFYSVTNLDKLSLLLHDTKFVTTLGEIPGYIASCAAYYDWVVLPKPLRSGQELLTHLKVTQTTYPMEDLLKMADLLDTVDFTNKDDSIEVLENLNQKYFNSNEYDSSFKKILVQLIGCYLYNPIVH
jgi:hypothetical protein